MSQDLKMLEGFDLKKKKKIFASLTLGVSNGWV